MPFARPLSLIFACAALFFALGVAPPLARAGDKALAEVFFQEGRKLLEEGKYAEARAKFEASQKQDPSPGTLLNIGKCNEALGKTATAWTNYKEAQSLATNMSRPEQETLAAERAQAIEPKLSRLKIEPPPSIPPGLTVKRSGVVIDTDALGVAVPVDPGEYVIEASAPGFVTFTGKVRVGSEKDNARLSIPELKKSNAVEPGPAPFAPGETAAPASPSNAPVGAQADSSSASKRTIAYVITGAGAGLIIAGGIFGYLASKQATNAENDPSLCPEKACYPEGRDEINGAKGKALVSTIAVAGGVALLGAGIVLVVITPPDRERAAHRRTQRARVAPFADPRGSGGLIFTGAF